jgi:hypothetical protein
MSTELTWNERLNRLESIFGLRIVPEAATTGGRRSPAQWCEWLRRYGPLFVEVEGNPSHVVVLYGLIAWSGSVTMYVNDPWDRSIRFDPADPVAFNPPNHGWHGRLSFEQFLHDFHGVSLVVEGGRSRVMYIP